MTVSVFRKLSSYTSLPLFHKLWFVPIWLMLGLARAMVLVVPFRLIAPILGQGLGTSAAVPLAGPKQETRARQIGQTIRLASRYSPWDANCLAQAIVARIVMGLYGVPYVLFFGLSRSAGQAGLDAHAWTVSGRVAVTGGYSFDRFTIVGVYAG